MLVKRLEDNALGLIDPELSLGRIKFIQILLGKVLPDQKTVEHTRGIDKNVAWLPQLAKDSGEWTSNYVPSGSPTQDPKPCRQATE
jgi:hypothetical protein